MRDSAAAVGSLLREVGQALRFNRQRSILTTLSLAWGVASFVILFRAGTDCGAIVGVAGVAGGIADAGGGAAI